MVQNPNKQLNVEIVQGRTVRKNKQNLLQRNQKKKQANQSKKLPKFVLNA
jgi:hypothetical protein